MMEHLFSLVPFPDPVLPAISISGKIARAQDLLSIHYSLTGDIDNILIPRTGSQPGRKDGLWTATCFELFLSIRDRPEYWEFNFSPSGYWNVYRMDAYRRIGFREEILIGQLQIETQKNADYFSAAAYVDLSPIIPTGKIIQAGVTSIIQTRAGQESYWALAHPALQADFHTRESFHIQL